MARFAAAVATLLVSVAGCLQDETKDVIDDANGKVPLDRDAIYARVKGLMEGVACEAPFDATKTTANLKDLASLVVDVEGKTYGSRELDVHGDLALTTLYGYGGIAVLDLSDPLKPQQLGAIKAGGELDVKFSPDNLTALVGGGSGIQLIDIRDPANLSMVGEWKFAEAPQPPRGGALQNAHMIYAANISGQQWVFLAPNSNTGVWILKLEGPPEARKLTYVTQTLPVEGGPLGPHDMVVQWDADLKTWVLYSADGFHGWTAFDVKDPAKPMPLGGIIRPETGYTHTIQAAKIGARRIVVTIQEVGVNVMEVYDATNIKAPILLGTWQHERAAVNPQHNLNIVAGRLYVAHYGNGVYVFDLNKLGTTPIASEVKPVAHYGGASTSQDALGFKEFYDVVVKDGVVYAASYSAPTSGVHVVGDSCLVPGDEKLTTFG
ncbi:MAG: hypothetical protein HYT80_06150 [Euryarchaeota archaeon]|nr:hypothetical protein [Euryarchaeota archaeon]